MNRKIWIVLGVALAAWVLHLATAFAGPLVRPEPRVEPDSQAALGSSFTYQGRLNDGAGPVNGNCDMAFRLYDADTGGSQVGSVINASVPVSDGLFTVMLNEGDEFGPTAFAGDARWLGIQVKCQGDVSFTDLGRQELTAAPYALYAQGAPWGGLTGVPGGFADGVDHTDDTVSWTEISGIVGSGASQVARGSHSHSGSNYQNVVVVAKRGGDYTSVQAALDSITDAAVGNHYLVWVAPGTYTETVTMKAYVDIEGAGELATKITYTGSASGDTGTVVGADNAELRFLTVENTGGSTYATAIYNDGSSPRLTHVTADASGGAYNFGVYNAESSSPTMTNVTTSASGGTDNYGVYNSSSSPTMTNVTANASGGTFNYGVFNSSSSPTMTAVTADASGGGYHYGVYNTLNSSPTMTDVTASASGGTDNYGVYNTLYSSPTMTGVTASASGGTSFNYGVYNGYSESTMMDVTASASGGTDSRGVYNFYSSPTMTSVTASASGGTDNYGVYNHSFSPTIQNSTLTASGGTNNYGIYNFASTGSYTVTVNNCQITGSSNTISNDDEFTTLVGGSLLSGGPVTGGGTVTCAGVYDETYTWYDSTCP